MVYESDFSRRQFLNSCAESGLFYSSPDYKPQGYLSTLRPPSTSASASALSPSPIGSRSERTANFLASLARTTQPLGVRSSPQPQIRQPFDLQHPYTTSDAAENPVSPNDTSNGLHQRRSVPRFTEEPRGCCACCHSCGGGRRSDRFIPPERSLDPFGNSSLKSQHGMESYLKSRRPLTQEEDGLQTQPRSPYTVRNIPVRSLDELRETVAIRRDYFRERQKQLNGSPVNSGALTLASSRATSASPQPDGSIVTYPSDDEVGLAEGSTVTLASGSAGGSYYAVDE